MAQIDHAAKNNKLPWDAYLVKAISEIARHVEKYPDLPSEQVEVKPVRNKPSQPRSQPKVSKKPETPKPVSQPVPVPVVPVAEPMVPKGKKKKRGRRGGKKHKKK
jgi:hypothetical protein